MINTVKMTPEQYSVQSRDYQVIARLYTALFNLSKMYIDNNHFWTNDIDKKLSKLRAYSLNFRTKYDWDLEDLKVVSSCFKYLMFRKGTRQALRYCIYILMRIKNLEGTITDNSIEVDDNLITIKIPENLTSLGAIEDLIKYLIPAGFSYRIIEYQEFNPNAVTNISAYYDSTDVMTGTIESYKLTIRGNSEENINAIDYTGYGTEGSYGNSIVNGEIHDNTGDAPLAEV